VNRLPVLILLSVLALVPGWSGASAASPSVDTGVSYLYEEHPLAFERIAASGAKLVHGWLRWTEVAPAAEPAAWNPRDPKDPNYDWDRMDEWVRNSVSAGLTPLLQIYYAPKWANRCTATNGLDTRPPYPPCNPNPRKLADFGYAAALRYSGRFKGLPRVRYWQPMNEPNLDLFFQPQFDSRGRSISAGIYRALLNRFYVAVKEVNSSNMVLAAGLAPNAVPGRAVAPMTFARNLLCMTAHKRPKPLPGNCGGGVRMDIFDMHPYTSGGPTHKAAGKDNVQMGNLGKLRRLIAAADRAGNIKGRGNRTPLWVTEMAWDSNPPDPGGLPLWLLTRWTSEAIYRSWQAGVSKFFWYTLRDQDPGVLPFSATTQAGLFFRGEDLENDSPKRNLAAFRFPFVAFPKGNRIFIWGRTPTSARGTVVIERRFGKRWKTLAAVRANSNGLFRSVVKAGAKYNRRGMVRAKFRGDFAVPFSLRDVQDRDVRPFG